MEARSITHGVVYSEVSANSQRVQGLIGSHAHQVSFAEARIAVKNDGKSTPLTFTTHAGFMEMAIPDPSKGELKRALLGQRGFFENFRVSFDWQKRVFHIDMPV